MELSFRFPLAIVLRILAASPAGWRFRRSESAPVGGSEWTTLYVLPPVSLRYDGHRAVYLSLRANVEKIEGARCGACSDMSADGHNLACPEGPNLCSACEAPAETFGAGNVCGPCLGL